MRPASVDQKTSIPVRTKVVITAGFRAVERAVREVKIGEGVFTTSTVDVLLGERSTALTVLKAVDPLIDGLRRNDYARLQWLGADYFGLYSI